MRLLGFTPTKKMLEQAKSVEYTIVHSEVVMQDEPIMEAVLVPVIELPTYDPNKKTVLSPLPSKKKPSSQLKRKVTLNPLSDD